MFAPANNRLDPAPARLLLPPISTTLSNDNAPLADPEPIPTVTTARRVEPTPAMTRLTIHVSDTQRVDEADDDPSLPPGVKPATPNEPPNTVTDTDPVVGTLRTGSIEVTGASADSTPVAEPESTDVLSTTALLPPTTRLGLHSTAVSDLHVEPTHAV